VLLAGLSGRMRSSHVPPLAGARSPLLVLNNLDARLKNQVAGYFGVAISALVAAAAAAATTTTTSAAPRATAPPEVLSGCLLVPSVIIGQVNPTYDPLGAHSLFGWTHGSLYQ
jgi:hypothetical protein